MLLLFYAARLMSASLPCSRLFGDHVLLVRPARVRPALSHEDVVTIPLTAFDPVPQQHYRGKIG